MVPPACLHRQGEARTTQQQRGDDATAALLAMHTCFRLAGGHGVIFIQEDNRLITERGTQRPGEFKNALPGAGMRPGEASKRARENERLLGPHGTMTHRVCAECSEDFAGPASFRGKAPKCSGCRRTTHPQRQHAPSCAGTSPQNATAGSAPRHMTPRESVCACHCAALPWCSRLPRS